MTNGSTPHSSTEKRESAFQSDDKMDREDDVREKQPITPESGNSEDGKEGKQK